jgi:hypothetical protein
MMPTRPSIMSDGGDDVRARRRLHQRLLDQDVGRLVVQDVAIFVGDPVMPVRGVGVQSDVGEDADPREPPLSLP